MSRSTISTFQLFELIPDEKAAIAYLEGRLWKNGRARITYEQLKDGKTWFDADSLAQEI